MADFIPPARPLIGHEERAAVDRVLRSGMLAQGPEVAAFEAEFAVHFGLDRPCVAVNSGTSALHLGLLSAGVGPGDEVVVPSFTFAATANAVALTGAVPVFADIDPVSFCIDPESVAASITDRTVGVMPVHLYGHPADMGELQKIADRHGLQIFEDAAQAHGASLAGTPVGAFGSFGAFSLYPTKNMTSGEGGMISVAQPGVQRLLRLYPQSGYGAGVRERGRRFQQPDERHPRGDRPGAVDQGGGMDASAPEQRPVPLRASQRSADSISCPRCRPRIPPVHHPCPRGPRWFCPGAAQRVRNWLGEFLSDPGPPIGSFSLTDRPAGNRSCRRGMSLAAGSSVGRSGRSRTHRARRQHPGPGRRIRMTRLRAGLIGLGMMGRNHARVLSSLDEVDLVAVVDPGGDLHSAAGGREVLREVDDLIGVGVDYCVVAAPTAQHLAIGLQLAEAGIHTLIEKPLAHDSPASRKLVEAFAERGLVGAVGHIERYNAALQSARKRLENGDLGTVYQIITRRQGPFPGRIADVGVVKDLATHDIDLTAWVSQQHFTSVSARTAFRSGREYEDLVAVVGSLADGTITNHLVNWLSPLKERVTIMTGERGAFVADTLTADLTFFANGSVPTTWGGLQQFRGVSEGDMVRYAIHKPEPLRVEHENFRDAILGRPADIVTMEQGLTTVVVAEAIIESAATGTTLTLEPPW